MRLFVLFRRNRRWLRQIDAHVDGRLTPVERALLDERVGESPAVQQALDATRSLKQSLREMPEHPVPRSFAITEAMLADTAPTPVPRAVGVTMRLAQVTAAAAFAAFAVLVSMDVRSSSNSGDEQDTAGAPFSALSSEGGATDSTAERSGKAAPPSATGDAGGGQPVAPGAESGTPLPGDAAGVAPAAEASEPSRAESDGARDDMLVYAALTGVFVLACGAWAMSGLQRRRHRRPRLHA